jgi:hypothetical protein
VLVVAKIHTGQVALSPTRVHTKRAVRQTTPAGWGRHAHRHPPFPLWNYIHA